MKKILQIAGGVVLGAVIIFLGIYIFFTLSIKELDKARSKCKTEVKGVYDDLVASLKKKDDETVVFDNSDQFYELESYLSGAYKKCLKDEGVPDNLIENIID